MLTEEETLERAKYCYCVLLQLGTLQESGPVDPSRYLERLENSSLGLAGDEFVAVSLREAVMAGRPDGGLESLIAFYEGLIHALCTVLQTDLDEVQKAIPEEFLEMLVSEVSVGRTQ